MYIKNSKIIKKSEEIIESNYYLIFLEYIEIINDIFFIKSKKNILMVNIDLFVENAELLKYINLYICKTKFTCKCLNKLIEKKKIRPAELLYTSHTSIPDNLYIPTIKKNFKYFLHSAGKSPFKNTYLIIKTWLQYDLPPIIITCYDFCIKKLKKFGIKLNLNEFKKHNIIFYSNKLNPQKIIYYKNYCGFHLCPSQREGYGHYLNEARIVKAIAITVDGEPMNELVNKDSGFLIPCKIAFTSDWNFSNFYVFKPIDLYNTIKKALETKISKLEEMAENSYNNYLVDSEYFINHIGDIRN